MTPRPVTMAQAIRLILHGGNVRTVADATGMTAKTVRKWCDHGAIPRGQIDHVQRRLGVFLTDPPGKRDRLYRVDPRPRAVVEEQAPTVLPSARDRDGNGIIRSGSPSSWGALWMPGAVPSYADAAGRFPGGRG